MPTSVATAKRVAVKGVGWSKRMSIAAEKYDHVSKAILGVLTVEPIKFADLVRLVERRLPDFDGSIPWYTITVARELEAQGKIVRHDKPVFYSKPGARSRGARGSARPARTKAAARRR